MDYNQLTSFYNKLESTTKRLEKTKLLAEFLKSIKDHKDKSIIYLLRGRLFPDYDRRDMGVSEQLVIKVISKASGVTTEQVTKKWKSIGDLGSVAQELIKLKKQQTFSTQRLTVEKVLDNLRMLTEMTGKGVIDKKLALIIELLTSASPIEAKFLVRTLLGDLRIGLGEGVLRDAITQSCFSKDDKEAAKLVEEAYNSSTDFVKVFERALKGRDELKQAELQPGRPVKVMLFLKVSDVKEGFEVVGKPAALEFKYDGFRMMINKDEKGRVKIFTRRLEEVTNQFPEVVDYVNNYVKAQNFILDSEAVGFSRDTGKYKPFQEISQRIKRKYNIAELSHELPVEINVFDILYYNGKSLLNEPFKKRRELLEKIVKGKRWELVLANQLITGDEAKAQEFYERAVSEGEEGVMIKSLEAPYKPGARVGYGVKLKPIANEFDLVIIKAEYGTGKRSGWLTSYTVACRDGRSLLEIGKVSTGLKEKSDEGLSFEEVTKRLKPLIKNEHGREVTVKPDIVATITYQNIQKSPSYSSGFALRFPRFTALRPDRNVSDIATLDEVKRDYAKAEGKVFKQ